eukprot:scaffold4772_cov153-Amphora_coffeaeformis.AAC.3
MGSSVVAAAMGRKANGTGNNDSSRNLVVPCKMEATASGGDAISAGNHCAGTNEGHAGCRQCIWIRCPFVVGVAHKAPCPCCVTAAAVAGVSCRAGKFTKDRMGVPNSSAVKFLSCPCKWNSKITT